MLSFEGADSVRFLNGQITQDVRLVAGNDLVLPSCITDAKGKLQFRVWITEEGGRILMFCRGDQVNAIRERITRYLIADDVEVREVSEEIDMGRYEFVELTEEERIENAIPRWGHELREGMLPPEAKLDDTDISYSKGCYIGQEVISRIKSAKKLNREMVRFDFTGPGSLGSIVDGDGKVWGEVTSVAGTRGLGFLKRSAPVGGVLSVNGVMLEVR